MQVQRLMASQKHGLEQAPISFDEALAGHLGQFGPHQRRVFLLVSVLWLPNALLILMPVFANEDPVKAHWWRCVNANDTQCATTFAQDLPGQDFCALSSDQWEWTHPNWSIVSQWNLLCSKAVLSQLVSSAFFLGYLFGSGIFGSMADHHGRRKTLMLASGLAVLTTLMSALSPSFWVFFTSRLLTGIGAAGQAMVTYLLATESVGPSWRGSAGVGTQMFFVLGEFLLVIVALIFKPWRLMCVAIVVIGGAAMFLILLVPESPRWLLAKGRTTEANAIIQRIADENGTRPPLAPLAGGNPDPEPGDDPAGSTGDSGTGGSASTHPAHVSLCSVLKDRHIFRRFVILSYVWCILCLTYYGISLALGGLQGSLYLTFSMSALAEIPSNLLAAWLIEKIGRHNSLAAGMLLSGGSCLICSFMPAGAGQAVFATAAKFGCAGAFTIASIYTSELFPTLVRSAVLGLENEAARVGGIAAPFVVLLGTQMHSSSLPFLVFGSTSVLAGLLIFTLPETLGSTLPETMKDMEGIQSIFTTGAWKKGWSATRAGLFSTHAFSFTHPKQHAGAPHLTTVREDSAEGPSTHAAAHEHEATPMLGSSPADSAHHHHHEEKTGHDFVIRAGVDGVVGSTSSQAANMTAGGVDVAVDEAHHHERSALLRPQ